MKLACLIIFTILSIGLSLFVGTADLSMSQSLSGLLGHGSELENLIMQQLRLPRAAMALSLIHI